MIVPIVKRIIIDLKAHFFGESLAKSFISDGDSFLNLFIDDVFGEEFGQRFRDFSFHKFGNALESVGSAFEFIEVFESDSVISRIHTIFAIL